MRTVTSQSNDAGGGGAGQKVHIQSIHMSSQKMSTSQSDGKQVVSWERVEMRDRKDDWGHEETLWVDEPTSHPDWNEGPTEVKIY